MSGGRRNLAIGAAGFAALLAVVLGILFAAGGSEATAQGAGGQPGGQHSFEGVASCGGTTCHGRSVANAAPGAQTASVQDGAPIGVVRQDEILIWQDPASAAGAHSRAFAVLQEPRSRDIVRRLGLGGEATSVPECLGCHATPAKPGLRGARFLLSDGVSCEGCHGAAGNWLSYHYSAGATREGNQRRGLIPLENPVKRAEVCLDCHFGSAEPNRFVSHELMAAGHPRISFELDLFSTLQAHHDEDQDYFDRKPEAKKFGNVQMWAIGQAIALRRSLELFTGNRGREGIFPEFYFLDCHSCHRQISDDPRFDPTVVDNRFRQLPQGMPPYNDENMIMLSAAARVVAPDLGRAFDDSSKRFHAAMASNPRDVETAANQLKGVAIRLAERIGETGISNAQVFRIIDTITSQAISERFTDYAGSVQAVMATDTLLSALVANGGVSQDAVQGIRTDIDGAYRAVREPNACRENRREEFCYNPHAFRASLSRAAAAIRRLR